MGGAWYDYLVVALVLPGGFQISVVPIIVGVSVITGLIWIRENAPFKQADHFVDAGVGILAGTLIGSRTGFVIFRWDYFENHLIEIVQLHLGGYSGAGAILGWMTAAFGIGRLTKHAGLELSDRFLPLAGCLAIGIWLGCWFVGKAYGSLSDRWWAMPAVDEWGVISNRFPVQLTGALFTLFLLLFIDRINAYSVRKHWLEKPGIPTALFLLAQSLILFILSFLRGDPLPLWMGLRLDTWISAGFFMMGVLLLSLILFKLKVISFLVFSDKQK